MRKPVGMANQGENLSSQCIIIICSETARAAVSDRCGSPVFVCFFMDGGFLSL